MINTVLALAASAALVAGGAADGPRDHPGGYGSSKLTLSYMADSGFADAVKLECDPAGGGHPHPDLACAELALVDGQVDRIEPARNACFLIYAPVTAEITGDWRGVPVTWSHKFGNMCEMRRATGALFDF
ncbi:SSI family serine proteinase inhibitor [Paractinoplanes durhamensis]|nr:SSI family serine proteinase inhibitor [Actinoplanes durhamensis]